MMMYLKSFLSFICVLTGIWVCTYIDKVSNITTRTKFSPAELAWLNVGWIAGAVLGLVGVFFLLKSLGAFEENPPTGSPPNNVYDV